MMRAALFAITVLTALALAAPADAQSRRELQMRLDNLEARLAQMETNAQAGDPLAETLLMRLDALEREQRVLTGEIERLTHENRQLRQQIEQSRTASRAMHGEDNGTAFEGAHPVLGSDEIDPDDPFGEARAGAVQPLRLPDNGGSPARPDASSASDPDALFARARTRLLDGDFAGARDGFQTFTERHGDHPQAGEAWYWLGETHFVNGDLQDAADAYIASLRADQRGGRAPDALVRLAASLAGLGQTSRACQLLGSFPREYPNASQDARRRAERERTRIGC
ncbi:tetratricopeptide repeat protein [Alkalicaulis satelles]|uniref:Cell division coordinator CpoB n=1 Tax=Alkalicaulis satelles TaxID=2609175 RepID=A0A5M6ZDQ3_9PROT|nr:tetratricopeptide repeat protein [Alkalicaulis satelles]KAA5802350.1 tetratricopeptide repeat protein [Alkalicaulis satelles]